MQRRIKILKIKILKIKILKIKILSTTLPIFYKQQPTESQKQPKNTVVLNQKLNGLYSFP